MLELQQPYNQFSEHDEEVLSRLASEATGRFCEIGCWTGHSTSILARRAKELGTKLIVIDNFKGNEGTPLSEYAKENNVQEIFIDNMKKLGLWDSIILFCLDSKEAHQYIEGSSLGLLFIDAGHSYSDVLSDIVHYLPKVKANGIICGHDYESNTYDEKYINEDYVDGKHHGVIKAVNETFRKTVNYEGRMWWVK